VRTSSAHPSRRGAILGLVALTSAVLVLSGCAGSSSSASSSPVNGGTLTYASGDAEPTCLDPHVGGNYPQALISTQYLETLVGRDADGKTTPWLATKWKTSPDGLTVDFTLRSGVKFTDGTDLTADVVKANVEHVQNPATQSSTGYLAFQKIKSVEAVDAHTARFHLSEPDAALLESLAQPWNAIESAQALARPLKVNCQSPVGTGPFKVASWQNQQAVTLVRNDHYTSPAADATHTGNARLKKIVWRFIPDTSTRYAALKSGEVDVIDNPQPDSVAAALKKSSNGITAVQAPRPGSVNRIELNMSKAPFNDERVREAFVKASPVNAGIKSLFFGTVKRSYSPLSSVEPLAYSDKSLFGTDLAQAKKLLDEAGWTVGSDGIRTKDGQRLTVQFPVSTNQSIPAEQSLFEQIQAAAKQAGFEVKLTPLDLSSWYSALAKNDYDAVSAPYTKVGPDVLRILYASDGTKPAPSGYFANHAQIQDPQLDALLNTAATTLSAGTRADAVKQAQQIILRSYAILPLYDQQNNFLVGEKVQGMRINHAVSAPTFADAWLTR
jgi:peptide/nickel transport system substrate-binding protein